jgi:hypothetical protein
VCLIQINDVDGPSFLGFHESIEAAKEAVKDIPLESQNLEWSGDKGQWLSAWSGHDIYLIIELPDGVIG